MTPERMAKLVTRWVRFYTRDLPTSIARRRTDEIGADLHDHVAHERARGASDRHIALGIASRMVRGVAADASWRRQHAATKKHKTFYRSAVGVVRGTGLILLVPLLAMQFTDEAAWSPADFAVAGVLVVGIVGAIVARFRPEGMARALLAMAIAQALVAAIALIAGRHQAPITSVGEILGLNGFFVVLFAGSAWLFGVPRAGRLPQTRGRGPR